MKSILEKAKKIEQEIIDNRRYLHKNPEVGFYLPKTAEFVKEQLNKIGIEGKGCGILETSVREKYKAAGFPDGEASTGVVATIGSGSPCILLRADMDALPMKETTGLDYASENNAAHMCGHDSHTAMLLGAAKILKEHERDLKGTVKLMFQPAEEYGYGSKTMIDDGVLQNPKVDVAMAIHIMPDSNVGKIEFNRGIATAAMDTYVLKIKGKGCHSSMPHQGIDSNMILSQIYTALNLLPTREADPKETVALTAGKISGGSAANIIPDTADMQVGMRTFNMEVRNHLTKRIPEMIDHYVKAWRGEYDLTIFGTPSTFTNPDLLDELLPFIKETAGEENVEELKTPMSGTEDFSYIAEKVPSVFLKLGAGSPTSYPLHNPNMILDESVFALGAATYANCAIEWLNNQSK